MLNLDTHILVHAITDELKPKEEELLRSEDWSISSIVYWELSKLAQLDRIEIDLHDPDVVRVLTKVHVWPLSLEVCLAIQDLDFRSDPADELIAATSLVHNVALVTRDAVIRGSEVVPLA